MSAKHNPLELPAGLPVPEDDGACDHLPGTAVPSLLTPLVSGQARDLAAESRRRRVVLFCFPRVGRPGLAPLGGEDQWNSIPGARGCTPQCISYANLAAQFAELGATVYGMSTQSIDDLREAAARLSLPYELTSDQNLAFATALRLPTFSVADHTLLRRLTLVIRDRVIEKVRYPVFPSNQDAIDILSWLRGIS